MTRLVSPELRRALDDPEIRHRIVDAWLLRLRREGQATRDGRRVIRQGSRTGDEDTKTTTNHVQRD